MLMTWMIFMKILKNKIQVKSVENLLLIFHDMFADIPSNEKIQ